jgi:hypothetical protein
MPEMKFQPPGLDPFQWISYVMNFFSLTPLKMDANGKPKTEIPQVDFYETTAFSDSLSRF